MFEDSLRRGLAEGLAVGEDRLRVEVRLDGEPVVGRRVEHVEVVEVVAAVEPSDDDVEPSEEVDVTPAPARADRAPRGEGGTTEPPPVSAEDLDEEAEAAADLLEGLLDAMDLPGDLRIQVHETYAEVEIVGIDEGVLIGRRGQTLEALQDLIRTAMQRRFERRSRVMVDVDGYRARRLEKLLERADEAVAEVLDSGEPQRLEPMDSIERRLVHQRVASNPGVVSHSHGREPARRIEIRLAEDED